MFQLLKVHNRLVKKGERHDDKIMGALTNFSPVGIEI